MVIDYVYSDSSTNELNLLIEEAIRQTGNISFDRDSIDHKMPMEEILNAALDKVDLIIANLAKNDGDVNLEVGFALGRNKAVLILCEQQDLDLVNPDFFDCLSIVYNSQRIEETLITPLKKYLSVDNLEKYLQKQKNEFQRKKEIKTVFVSYSHADTHYLDRLNVHIKPFEKSGIIDFWSDSKIKAGEKWKDKIVAALNKATIAILLISADFLASDFIVENELPPLLKSAEEKGTLILPVILKPCRFTKNKSLSIFQSINDPANPMSKMDESQREEVYVKICDYIDNLVT